MSSQLSSEHAQNSMSVAENRKQNSSSGTHDRDAMPNMNESVPEMPSDDSVKSSEADEDNFDVDGLPMPRVTSSTIPIVLEVAPRNGGFPSNDPLFQGICLYSGSMTSSQREKAKSRHYKNQKRLAHLHGRFLRSSACIKEDMKRNDFG